MECELCHRTYETQRKLTFHRSHVHRRRRLELSPLKELDDVERLLDYVPGLGGSVVLNPRGFCGDALQTVLEGKGKCKVYTNGGIGARYRSVLRQPYLSKLLHRMKPSAVVCYNELSSDDIGSVSRCRVKLVILRVDDADEHLHLRPSRVIPLDTGSWMIWE